MGNKKELISTSEEKNKILLALSEVYFSVHYANLETGQFEEIKSIEFVHELIYDSANIEEAVKVYLPQGVDEKYTEKIARFIDYKTVAKRLGRKPSISTTFRSKLEEYEYCRASWIAVRRNEEGVVTHVLYAVENITESVKQELATKKIVEEKIERQYRIVESLSKEYLNVTLLNPRDKKIRFIKVGGLLSVWYGDGEVQETDFDTLCAKFLNSEYLYPDDLEMMRQVLNLENIKAQLQNAAEYVGMYRILEDDGVHYCQYKFLKVEDSDEIVGAFRSIDDTIKRELELKKTLEADVQKIKGIASEYTIMHFLDLEKDEYVSYYVADNPKDEELKIGAVMHDYYEAYQKSLDEVCHPDHYVYMLRFTEKEEIKRVLRNKKRYVQRFKYLNKQGEYRWKNLIFIKFDDIDEEATKIAVGYTDAEEEVAAEMRHDRALKEAARKAKAADQAKTNFLFNMSHDIRTPMNAILGFTELLERNLGKEDVERKYIDKIKVSSEFLLSLINNVLEMAEIENGTIILDETVHNVHEILEIMKPVFESRLKEKDITFISSINVKNQYVMVDPVKMKEIALNLFSNAVKYTPNGGTIRYEIEEVPYEKEGYCLIKTIIADTGIGMSEQFLPHLFEEFVRERSTTESKNLGTGLGMPIVKSLVELMGGTIEVESELGVGTTFTLLIPHRIAKKEDIERNEKKVRKYDRHMFSGKRVLLAEDNEMNAEIATAFLKEVGFAVEHAEDGVICLNMVQQATCGYYDVILMDIQMPNMNGYKASEEIRNLFDPGLSRIPIIAMTANAFEEDKKNALKAGMNAHIGKPFKPAELIETISSVLG